MAETIPDQSRQNAQGGGAEISPGGKGALWGWLWRHPLALVILALCLFLPGAWKTEDGGGEDTGSVLTALQGIHSKRQAGDLYTECFKFLLNVVTPDPVTAVMLMRLFTLVLGSVSLYLVLTCFSKYLRRGAILFATFAWTASCLNAPVVQSTSLSAFSFGIMMLGVYFLLRSWSVSGVVGFYILGLAAASLRPEYMAPVILVTLFFIVAAVWKCIGFLKTSFGIPRRKSGLITLLLSIAFLAVMIIHPTPGVRAKMEYCDSYMLFGFGQCYADFYRKEHPQEIFSPMTEYRWLLDRDFGGPKTFAAILRNNPKEAFRYFFHNSLDNLESIPHSLLIARDKGDGVYAKRAYKVVLWILLGGGLLGLFRLRRFYLKVTREKNERGWRALAAFAVEERLVLCNTLVLVMLVSASSVAIFLLVGSPRYWITMVPLLYLALAYATDSLLALWKLARLEQLIVALSLLAFCSPNFIIPHPAYEYRALQHIAPLVRNHPVIGSWWATPDRVYGFNGDASDVSISDGIDAKDIAAGRFDILMIDGNFRGTQVWTKQREFFEALMSDPAKYGFKKVDDIPTGRFDVLYRPKATGT